MPSNVNELNLKNAETQVQKRTNLNLLTKRAKSGTIVTGTIFTSAAEKTINRSL